MAEALAIVGLVSSIITFVDAAQKVVSRLKDYWESGRELPKAYANVKNQLAFMVPEVEEMKNEYHKGLIPADKAVGLHDAIEACNRQTARLNAILDDVLPAPNDSKIQRGRKTLRSLRREKEVAGIQASIESSKSTFTLYYVRHPVSLPIRPKVSWLERCCDIPATSVLRFVGREDVLRRLDEIFGVGSASPSDTTLDQPRRAVLLGMGGQGKTQTALRYCQKAFQHRTFNTVLWIDASSETSAHQAINSILSKAEIPTSALEFERNLISFKDALTSLKGPCLLVFDNYDTPRNFSNIADMFVHHEQICIMLTSRHHESLRLGTHIHVREMDQSDAEDLLLMSSGLVRQNVNPQNLERTVNMLGCLPLALDQAGAYIRKLHLSLDVFEKHYIERQKKILQYTPDLFEYRKSLSPGSEPSVLSVFTTWELSLEQLGDDQPHLEHLLTLSAFFDPRKVHEALFSTRSTLNFTACSGVEDGWLQCMLTDSAWDSYRFQDIIANMYGLSLLQKFWIEDGHMVFSLHPLVSDWLRTRIGEKDRASMAVEAAVTAAVSDDCPNLSSHINRCCQGLSDYAEIFFGDCIDMRYPRTVMNCAPAAQYFIGELDPKPLYGRAEALCCPHGRPCQIVPSTIRLKNIMSRYIMITAFADVQKQSPKPTTGFSADQSSIRTIDEYIDFLTIVCHHFRLSTYHLCVSSKRFLKKVGEALNEYRTLLLGDQTLFVSTKLIQKIATFQQQVAYLDALSIGLEEAAAGVEQAVKMFADRSLLEESSQTHLWLRANFSALQLSFKDHLNLSPPSNLPGKGGPMRDQLRLLPFLESGWSPSRPSETSSILSDVDILSQADEPIWSPPLLLAHSPSTADTIHIPALSVEDSESVDRPPLSSATQTSVHAPAAAPNIVCTGSNTMQPQGT